MESTQRLPTCGCSALQSLYHRLSLEVWRWWRAFVAALVLTATAMVGDGRPRPPPPSTIDDPIFDETGRLVCPRCCMRFGSYANYVQHKRVEDRLLATTSFRVPPDAGTLGIDATDASQAAAATTASGAAAAAAAPAGAAPAAVAAAGAAAVAQANREPLRDGVPSACVHPTATLAHEATAAAARASTNSLDPKDMPTARAVDAHALSFAHPPSPPIQPPMPKCFPIAIGASSTTVANRIARHYRAKGDLLRTKLHVPPHLRDRPSDFVLKEHKDMRLFSLTAGGCGLSRKARMEYYETTVAVERAAMKVVAEMDARRRRRKRGKNGKGRKPKPIVRIGPL